MATAGRGVTAPFSFPKAKYTSIGIVVATWNEEVTGRLLEGALEALSACGIQRHKILVREVPGTFELTHGAARLAPKVDAVIVLGCVVQGETPHFTFICEGVAQGITQLNITTGKPVIFGVLTTLNQEQALERAGGKHGNKGFEAGITALKMLHAFRHD
jgi:6,7-dimethyl-8-ribityllumazine synthase